MLFKNILFTERKYEKKTTNISKKKNETKSACNCQEGNEWASNASLSDSK